MYDAQSEPMDGWEPGLVEPALEGRSRDPGSRRASWIATGVLVVLALATFVLQQMGAAAESKPKQGPESASGIIPARKSDPEVMSAEFMVRFGHVIKSMSAPAGGQGGGKAGGPSPVRMIAENLEPPPGASPEDHLRLAIATAELEGGEAGLERLENFRASLEDGTWRSIPAEGEATLRADAEALEKIFALPKGGGADAGGLLPEGFEARHGYFGRIAKSWGLPDDSPQRRALLGNGGPILAILVVFGMVVVVVVLGGFAMGIVALVMLASGRIRWRFVPPTPGGSVFVETAAVFFTGFLGMQILAGVIKSSAGIDEATATRLTLMAQWLLVPIIAWPVVRGMPWGAWRRAVGLHSGEGVFKEIACGILGYFAGVPLMLAAFLVSVFALMVKGLMSGAGGSGGPVETPENPIVDIVMQGGLMPWLLFALAAFWAPLVEEVVFRGALYRHLRGRFGGAIGVVVSAAVTAVVFGIAHGYEWMLLAPVITLGFNFALMREWRGSLIAPIFAHFMHNATVLLLVIGLFSMLRE
jgi:membrane protease YdiL (CAAX protease family)